MTECSRLGGVADAVSVWERVHDQSTKHIHPRLRVNCAERVVPIEAEIPDAAIQLPSLFVLRVGLARFEALRGEVAVLFEIPS